MKRVFPILIDRTFFDAQYFLAWRVNELSKRVLNGDQTSRRIKNN